MGMLKPEPVSIAGDRSAASLIEYSVLIGLIAITVVSLVTGIGNWLVSAWQVLTTAINQ
jgi:Flp pilus assembly pilin Flp